MNGILMGNVRKLIFVGLVLLIGAASLFVVNLKNEPGKDLIIFTQIPGYLDTQDWYFGQNSRIVSIDPENTDKSFRILTDDFYSARSPQVSYDGTKFIFAGKLKENDTWQIWEMNLDDLKARQVTRQSSDCTDPAYLPDGGIVFSRVYNDSIAGRGYAIYTCHSDGSAVNRITFQPHADLVPSVVQDGRVLFVSQQLFPDQTNPKIIAVRPDGTKAELYYNSKGGRILNSRGYETADGRFIFIENHQDGTGFGNLVVLSQNRPLHSHQVIAKGGAERGFYSPYPITDKKLIVSFSGNSSTPYELYNFNLISNQLGTKLYADTEYHSVEAVMVKSRQIPKNLPNRVDESNTKNKGRLICMNTGLTDRYPDVISPPKPYGVQVLGISDLIGEVAVEKDGSFYIEVDPDTPFRFQTVDENGRLLNGPSSWIWVRPNESRGCIGCHEDRELAPENRVPDAIRKGVVSLMSVKSPNTKD